MRKAVFYIVLLVYVIMGCSENDNPIVDIPEPIISPYASPYDSTVIVSAILRKDLNDNVLKDIKGKIEGNTIIFESPYIVDAQYLTVSFETTGGGILSSNRDQVPDTTVLFDLTKQMCFNTEGRVKELQYTIECYYSGLPVLEINTPEGAPITSKAEWITDASLKLINIDGEVLNEGKLSIKGRGNTTWTKPKKGYALKLDEKTEILGMPSDKRWVLLSSYNDRTEIRSALGFEIARMTKLSWTPQGRFVELVLNGEHLGNYYLTEKIKISKNRVNIDKDNGIILEMDAHYDEEHKFMSSIRNLPYMIKEPDDITPDKFNFVQTFINSLEESIYDDNRFVKEEYLNYIDLETFVDWWIATEITQNQEPNHPASCYCVIDNRKVKMGPVWDFDCYTFNSHYRLDTLAIRNALYYDRLFDSSSFINILKKRWSELMPKYQAFLPTFIDSLVEQTRQSATLDMRKWPYSWTVDTTGWDMESPYNPLSWLDSYRDYDDAIQTIKKTMRKKIENIDIFVKSL